MAPTTADTATHRQGESIALRRINPIKSLQNTVWLNALRLMNPLSTSAMPVS